jgi:ribosomal 50S subunit-recycling heat shock protein
MSGTGLRLDRLLWFLRLAPSRSAAQDWVLAGHFRINGQRVAKTAHNVRVGDVLTLPLAQGVRVVELVHLPHRRGPATEAAACYRDLTIPIESDSQRGEMIDDAAPRAIGEG